MGEYTKAIDAWMEKLPLSKSVLESTWLYHEIGRCHLELKYYQDAKEFGQKSLAAAEQADDKVWQLNATVLEAQAEGEFRSLCCLGLVYTERYDQVKIKKLGLSQKVNGMESEGSEEFLFIPILLLSLTIYNVVKTR